MKIILIVCLFSVLTLAQEPVVEVSLGDVLRYTYPGVEWTLEQPAPPEEPSITLWESDEPKPSIDALENIRDNPSEALLEAVRTGVFPDPPQP